MERFNENNVYNIIIISDNVRDIYIKKEWLQNALVKKMKKGVEPNSMILMESSSLKTITRMARKKHLEFGGCKCSMADDREARRRMANSLIEYSRYLATCED